MLRNKGSRRKASGRQVRAGLVFHGQHPESKTRPQEDTYVPMSAAKAVLAGETAKSQSPEVKYSRNLVWKSNFHIHQIEYE